MASSRENAIFVSWMYRVVFGGFCIVASMTCLGTVTSSTGPWFALLGAPLFVISVLAFRGARIEFCLNEVVVKTTWRSRRISRDDVEAVGITTGSNAAGVAWQVPYLRLRDGTWVIQQEIRALRKDTVVDRVVAYGQQWVKSTPIPSPDLSAGVSDDPPRRLKRKS